MNAKLAQQTTELCFSQFTLLHSGVTRGPLWSAEHLARVNLATVVGLRRPTSNAFHEEGQLPAGDRATLDDYRRSGYDRGHMSPNGDMSCLRRLRITVAALAENAATKSPNLL